MDKGIATHERIVDRALQLASRDGLAGLSIGGLATELGLSKSGLFAHFGSKEELQLQVLQAGVQRFVETVFRPALGVQRGLPRLRALFRAWLAWQKDPALPGGCLLVTAAVELDDQPGALRDFLVQAQRDLSSTLVRAVKLAIDCGHFASRVDASQFAFELWGIVLAWHHARRLLHDPQADRRAHDAFERLVEHSRGSEGGAK